MLKRAQDKWKNSGEFSVFYLLTIFRRRHTIVPLFTLFHVLYQIWSYRLEFPRLLAWCATHFKKFIHAGPARRNLHWVAGWMCKRKPQKYAPHSQMIISRTNSLCIFQPTNEIGFTGEGHVELPSPDLPKNGGFIFSFRTVKPQGLLLLAQGIKEDVSEPSVLKSPLAEQSCNLTSSQCIPQNFYSVSLSGGHVSAWFSAGAGVVTINSEKKYSDGVMHSVNVIKENRL